MTIPHVMFHPDGRNIVGRHASYKATEKIFSSSIILPLLITLEKAVHQVS